MQEGSLREILSELGVHVEGKRGKYLIASCPFASWTHHSGYDKSPSFAAIIDDSGGSNYVCKGCGKKGNIISLVRSLGKLRNEDYTRLITQTIHHESHREFKEWGDIYVEPIPEPIEEEIYYWLYQKPEEDSACVGYLRGRGISIETANKLGLLYDPEKRRILFPVRDAENKLYGFSGRRIYETENKRNPKILDYEGLPKKHLVLGEEKWVRGKPLIIVEGLFGYASLHEVGVDSVANIGALLGAEMTKQKAARIADAYLKTYLLLDNDMAGERGIFGDVDTGKTGAVGLLYKKVPLYIPAWPEGKEDPDQLTYDDILFMLENTTPYF